MSRAKHKSLAEKMDENELQGVQAPYSPYLGASYSTASVTGINPPVRAQMAQRCLRLVETKSIAGQLGVSVRTIQKWESGEAMIPRTRAVQIAHETKKYFLSDLRELETAIDQLLLQQYGRR